MNRYFRGNRFGCYFGSVADGEVLGLEEILANIQKRDLIDTTRQESPLRQASGALLVDTSFMTLDEQIEHICLLADGVRYHKTVSSHV